MKGYYDETKRSKTLKQSRSSSLFDVGTTGYLDVLGTKTDRHLGYKKVAFSYSHFRAYRTRKSVQAGVTEAKAKEITLGNLHPPSNLIPRHLTSFWSWGHLSLPNYENRPCRYDLSSFTGNGYLFLRPYKKEECIKR